MSAEDIIIRVENCYARGSSLKDEKFAVIPAWQINDINTKIHKNVVKVFLSISDADNEIMIILDVPANNETKEFICDTFLQLRKPPNQQSEWI